MITELFMGASDLVGTALWCSAFVVVAVFRHMHLTDKKRSLE